MVLVTPTNLLYAPPAMLTNLKYCFIAANITSAKQCNSSLMYSLKVSPLHLPIFCLSLSLYPTRDCKFSPPYLNEWASTLSIGITFNDGYFNAVVANFNAALMLSALRSFLFPSIQYADKYVFLFFTFYLIDMNRLPNSLTGLKIFISVVILVKKHSFPPIFIIIQF